MNPNTRSTIAAAAAVLIIVAMTARACWAVEMVVPNQSGGGIYITSEVCPDDAKKKLAYGRNPSGMTIFGCWSLIGEFVWIKWISGQVYSYPTGEFRSVVESRPAASKLSL